MASPKPQRLTQKSWLDRYIRVQQTYDVDLAKILQRAANDAEREIKKNPRLAALNTQALAERAWFTRGNDSREDLPVYENALLAAPGSCC